MLPAADHTAAPDAASSGRICAVAGQAQREMQAWAKDYADLFTDRAFDPALFSTLAQAAAFSGPWFSGDQLRMANRATLWCFGLDYLVDYAARTRQEAAAVAERCLAVAGGAPPEPGDDLTRFLADLRSELSAAPAWPVLAPVWHDDLRRMLGAMVRECGWKETRSADPRGGPDLADYLGNADNLGLSFVFTSHWLWVGPPPGPDEAADVRAASAAVQRVVRLLNDIATVDRDLRWGDLNALLLDVERAEVDRTLATLVGQARRLLRPLCQQRVWAAQYLERQMDFCAGFYRITDYWGTS